MNSDSGFWRLTLDPLWRVEVDGNLWLPLLLICLVGGARAVAAGGVDEPPVLGEGAVAGVCTDRGTQGVLRGARLSCCWSVFDTELITAVG